MTRSPSPLHLAPTLTLALAGAAMSGCGTDAGEINTVWPIGGTEEPQLMSSTFGPRLQKSRDSRYDFHRGIDIPAPMGTPVVAIAAGRVRRAGREPAFSDVVVQIEHCEGDDRCFYSTYLHLNMPVVRAGDWVEQGQHIGYSGLAASSLFPHLHFEIREGRPEKEYCVHPLRFLPTPFWMPPVLSLSAIDDATPSRVSVEVEVALPSSAPGLVEVAVATSVRSTGAVLEERVFDVEAWNRKYTADDNDVTIDQPSHEGIRIEPLEYTSGSAVYAARFRFSDLAGTAARGDLRVTARARDVGGNVSEVSSP